MNEHSHFRRWDPRGFKHVAHGRKDGEHNSVLKLFHVVAVLRAIADGKSARVGSVRATRRLHDLIALSMQHWSYEHKTSGYIKLGKNSLPNNVWYAFLQEIAKDTLTNVSSD